MSLALYMDTNVHGAVTRGLRARGIDVLTAQEDGHADAPDSVVLERASTLGRLLFTQDDDLIREATARQRDGIRFAGVVYAHQRRASIAQCIDDLELIALAASPEDTANRVEYLPLR